jgi:hypothetical protein
MPYLRVYNILFSLTKFMPEISLSFASSPYVENNALSAARGRHLEAVRRSF